jgi:hypothetical protein
VANLPPELANANYSVNAVAVDDTHIFLTAMNLPQSGNVGEPCAFLYDTEAGTFTAVPPPTDDAGTVLPITGFALSAIDGEVILVGGREVKKDGQNWTVSQDPLEMNGVPVKNVALRFDVKAKNWSEIRSKPQSGRAFATPVVVDGKIWLIGGEEVYTTAQGVRVSRSSTAVDIYDPKTGKFEAGPALPTGISFASAFVDGFGRVQLLGGASHTDFGRSLEVRSTILRLDPSLPHPTWKSKDDDVLPGPAAQLGIIPHAAGVVFGPFQRDDGSFYYEILR